MSMHLFSKDPDAVEEQLTLSESEVVHETVGKHWQIASEYWRASITAATSNSHSHRMCLSLFITLY